MLPDSIRNLPIETQVAVLYERVGNLGTEVKALKRALWSFVAAIISGSLLFLLSIASGWIGPGSHASAAFWSWLT